MQSLDQHESHQGQDSANHHGHRTTDGSRGVWIRRKTHYSVFLLSIIFIHTSVLKPEIYERELKYHSVCGTQRPPDQ